MKAIVGVWDDRGLSVFLDRLRMAGGFDVVPAGRAVGVKEIEGSGLVVMNLRPFPGTVEDIDIGGTALLRAAAKRFAAVAVVVDPDDYPGSRPRSPAAVFRSASGARWHTRRSSTSRPTTPRWPPPCAATRIPPTRRWAPTWSSGCGGSKASATERTRIRSRRSTRSSPPVPASSPRRTRSTARSSRTTTSSTPTRRGPLCATSMSRPSPSSSTPIPAVSPHAPIRPRPTGSPSPATPSPPSAGSPPATAS